MCEKWQYLFNNNINTFYLKQLSEHWRSPTQNIKKKNKEKTINSIGPVYNILNQSRTEDSSDKWNQDVLGRCIKIKCFWTKFPVCLLRISLLCCLQPLKVDTLGKITCHISKSVDKMCEDVLVQVSSQNNLCTCVRV